MFYLIFTVLRTQEGKEHELQVYETASKYHYAHTVAMMAATLTKRPMLVSACILVVLSTVL